MKLLHDGFGRVKRILLSFYMKTNEQFRRRMVSAFIFMFPLAIYLAFSNRNYGWDATMFTLQIQDGTAASLFHPNHILYNPMGFSVLKTLEATGILVSTALIMQGINAIAGAVGVLLFFRIILELSNRLDISAVFALLLAFSMAYWEYTVEVEVYIIPVVFLLASLLLMLDHLSENRKPEASLFVKLGLLTGLACVFHEMHALFIVVVLSFLILTIRSTWLKLKMLACYLTPGAFLAGGGYLAAAYATKSLSGFSTLWNYAISNLYHGEHWGTSGFGLHNFGLAAYGIFKTFFFKSTVRDSLLTNTLDGRDIVLLAILMVSVVLLVIMIGIAIINMKSIYTTNRKLTLIMVVWLFIYALFCLWFDPLTHEFWIPVLPPIWILIFLALKSWRFPKISESLWPGRKTAIPTVFLVLLFSVNFAGDVLPNSNIDNNENYQLANKFHDLGAKTGDMALVWGDVPLENYYKLFFEGNLRVTSLGRLPWTTKFPNITQEEGLTVFDQTIENILSAGGRVFINASELNPPSRESLSFLGEYKSVKIADYLEFYAKYQDRLIPVFQYKWRGVETRMFEILNPR